MRKYNTSDRTKATAAKAAKIEAGPCPEYHLPRTIGEIIKRINGQEMAVVLHPWGKCTQWRAVFPDGGETRGGMNKIDAEIRRRMPPLLGY